MRCAEASVPRSRFQQLVVESLTLTIGSGRIAEALFELETKSIPLLPFRCVVHCRLAKVGPEGIDIGLKRGPRAGASIEHLRAPCKLRLELLTGSFPGGGLVGTT